MFIIDCKLLLRVVSKFIGEIKLEVNRANVGEETVLDGVDCFYVFP